MSLLLFTCHSLFSHISLTLHKMIATGTPHATITLFYFIEFAPLFQNSYHIDLFLQQLE